MARKPSVLQWKAFALSSIAGLSLAAGYARAEREVKAALPSRVVRNPYAADIRPVRLPKNAQPPLRTAAVYHNPFAGEYTPPPLDTAFLPGPRSRWQSAIAPPVEVSPVRSAILAAPPASHVELGLQSLPVDNHRAARDTAFNSPAAVDSAPPRDPLSFAGDPLAQPIWLTSGDQDTLATSPTVQAEFVQLFPEQNSTSPASDVLYALSAAAADAPLIASQQGDSPERWLAEALQRARSAQSADELTNVIELCQRAMNAKPAVEVASGVRQLASWAHNRRGELVAEAGRPHKALRDFQAAVELDSSNSLAIHNRAVTLAQEEDFAAALSDFDRVIELNPGLAMAHRNRAELLATHGRIDEAVEDYTRAIEGFPDDAELRCARAHAFRRLGEPDRALADLDHAIRLAPDEPAALTQRGNILAEQDQFEQALDDFERAISIDPHWAEAYRSLAWLRATCPDDRYRDVQQALAAARQAAKLSQPDDYLALDALAAALARAGRFDQAIATQQRAISAAPTEFAGPLQHRLTLYKRRQPFRGEAAKDEK